MGVNLDKNPLVKSMVKILFYPEYYFSKNGFGSKVDLRRCIKIHRQRDGSLELTDQEEIGLLFWQIVESYFS